MIHIRRAARPIAIGMLLTASVGHADGYSTRFSSFRPLANSAGPTNYEGKPITFGNPDFRQVTIASLNGRRDDNEEDWYALAYSRYDLEFDEAREMARAALERWRAGETS